MRSLFDRILQSQLTNHVNSLIIRKAISLDLRFFEDPVFYDTLQNARRQADTSALNIVNSTLQMVQQVITLVSLVVLLVRFSPWLAVIVFVSAIPAFLSQSQYAERAFRAVTRRAPEARLLNYLEMLLTGNDTVKEIKLFGLGEPLLKRYQELFTRFYLEDRAIAERRTMAGLGWGLLSNLAYYGSYAWIVLRTIAGLITLGDMTMFLAIFRQSQSSIRVAARQPESPLREQPVPRQPDDVPEAAAAAGRAGQRPDRARAHPPGHRVPARLVSLPRFRRLRAARHQPAHPARASASRWSA